MSTIAENTFTRIHDDVSSLCKQKKIKLSNQTENEIRIWCTNSQLAQQYLDAICYLGSLNHNASESNEIYKLKNAKNHIDLDYPNGVSSLEGLYTIFKILLGTKDIFDYERLSHYASFIRGENHVKETRTIPPIKLDQIREYSGYREKVLKKLNQFTSPKELKTNLRLNAQFLEEDKRTQIGDEICRILYEALESENGKINAMISYLDFKSSLSKLLVEVVTILILSEKEVKIMFRSSHDVKKGKRNIDINSFRKKVEDELRTLYHGKKAIEEYEIPPNIQVELENPKYFRQWDHRYVTYFGDERMKDGIGHLHAKIFMNRQKGIVSSANMLSTSLESNIEVGAKVQSRELKELQTFFDMSWRCMRYG